jgi:Spy/CpxP family protein refolding chaperone
MQNTVKRLGQAIGIAAIATLTAGVGYQNISAQGPGGGFGGPGWRGGPGFGGPGGGALGPMMLGQLNLTTDQQDRVKQILDSHRADQQSINQRLAAAHQSLQAAISGTTFDESAVRGRAADLAAVDADASVLQARTYAEVFQILTPDQQQKLQTLQANMKARMEQAQQNRQGRQKGGQK